MDIAPATSANRQIARAAGTVIIAFLITQLTGLVRGILIYRAFGTTADLDSFNAANRVTEVLYNLMAGGALGSAFIPTFTALLTKEQRERAWKLASSIANLLLAVLTLACLVAAIFAPQIVRYGLFLLAPDQSPGQEALTTHLLRLMLPTVVIFGLSGLAMGILNAHQKFWLPAIAPAMYSLGQIVAVLFFPKELGIVRLAWGAVLGALLHLLVQAPDLLRLRGQFSLMLGLRLQEVRQVIILMGPRIIGVAVVQINFVVNTIVALSLPEGSVSSISLAFMWMLMPQAAIAQSVAIAAMPTFSAQVAAGKLDELRSSLTASLRGVLLLAIPASLGLILLRTPLIRLLYERGEFTAHSTEMVTWALLWYALGLTGHSLLEVIVRAFYAMHDTRTPVGVGVAAMGLNVALSLTLPGVFNNLGWLPLGGLALANSLATTLEMLTLLLLIRHRLKGINGWRLLVGVRQAILGTVVMGLLVWGWLALSAGRSTLAAAAGGALVGAGAYALAAWAQGLPEAHQLWGAFIRRLRSALAR
jgi:putative peptidoglycan lipid II flippase